MSLKTTHVYKAINNLEIQADVYRSGDQTKQPVLVWLHGGALIFGDRTMVSEEVRAFCREKSYILVSLDYRLAPETSISGIIDDVRDGLHWIRADGPSLCHADTSRLVVAGNSAGGYLTLMTGLFEPRPTALVSYYGYGDIDGAWYTKPSEDHRTDPLVTKEEAYGAVGKASPTGSSPHDDDTFHARIRYYMYLRQNGLWTREVTGFDPEEEADALNPYSPVRHVSSDYPPAMLIHGTKDADVPFDKSVDMAQKLAQHEVPHQLVPVPGAGHGLDDGDPALVQAAHQQALAFIQNHLGVRKT